MYMSAKLRLIVFLIISTMLFTIGCGVTDKKWTVTQYGNADGLQVKVIHTWDEHTETLSENLLNNGSMMFVVNGE